MSGNDGRSAGYLILFICCLVVLLFALSAFFGRAQAHDHEHPAMNEWLKSLHAKNKTWCCDGNDTDAIEDWETKGDHFRVKFRGQWFDVPDEAIVDAPNKSGGALLWMNKGYSGFSVRCFMPGTLS